MDDSAHLPLETAPLAGRGGRVPDGASAAGGKLHASGRLSLRARLNAVVAVMMIVFVAALMWVRVEDTRYSVREEIVGANRVAAQLIGHVQSLVAKGGTTAMAQFLERLGRVRANEITLLDDAGTVLYRSPPSTYKPGRDAPAWFAALVAPPVRQESYALGDGVLTIEANPSRAILDGWEDMVRLVQVAVLAIVAVNGVAFWAVGRIVRPFRVIIAGLEKMRRGDYSVRLPPLNGLEAGLIGETVNRLGAAIETNVQQRIATHETERRLAESRAWTRRVEQSLEIERREIAAELHDELGHSVTAIRSIARSLATRLAPHDRLNIDAVELIEREAARLYDAMHGMIPRLTPLDLGPAGLPDALRELVVATARLHPQFGIELDADGLRVPVGAAPALAAYRVAQESINNAIKHSGGSRVRVVLAGNEASGLQLTVTDDGRGMPVIPERNGHFGLAALRARILALGGSFSAEAGAGGGSCITARLPLGEPSA